MQAKSIYARVITLIGAQHFHSASPSEAEKLAAEITALVEQPANFMNVISSIDAYLSGEYRNNRSLSYLLQDSSMATLDECYVELTLISRDEQKIHEKAFKHNRIAPDYEQLYSQEAPIKVSELWQPDAYTRASKQRMVMQDSHKLPYHLVIRGAAGMGKTTLLRFIAAQWGKRHNEENASSDIIVNNTIDLTHWREQFNLLLHIPLRDLLVYEPIEEVLDTNDILSMREKMLAAWLKTHYRNLNKKQFIVLMLCLTRPQEVQRVLPKGVLLLLDGLDEVSGLLDEFKVSPGQNPEEYQATQKRLHECRRELLLTFLGHEHWLLTTRPHVAEHPTLSNTTHHLALTGFSLKQMKHYVEEFYRVFAYQKDIQPILTWLQQPQVRDLARVPLQLELLCSVVLEEEHVLVESGNLSVTELYTQMLVALSKRFLMKNPAYLKEKETVKDLSKEEWVARCAEPLEWLSLLAWEAMRNRKLEFSFTSLCEYPASGINRLLADNREPAQRTEKLQAAFQSFGLLITPVINKSSIYDQSYYFQHLTYQEFLAALALARQLLQSNSAERQILINMIQDPYYYRMQVFLVELLSGPFAATIFLADHSLMDRRTLTHTLLQAMQKSLPFSSNNIEKKHTEISLIQQQIEPQIKQKGDGVMLKSRGKNNEMQYERERGHVDNYPQYSDLLNENVLNLTLKEVNVFESLSLLRKDSTLMQTFRLVEAALAETRIPDDNLERLVQQFISVIINLIEQCFAPKLKDYVPKLSFFSKRLLEEERVKMFLEASWETSIRGILCWIRYLDCSLPFFLEEKIIAIDTRTAPADIQTELACAIGYLGVHSSELLQLKLLDVLQGSKSQKVKNSINDAIERLGVNACESLQINLVALLECALIEGNQIRVSAIVSAIERLGRYASNSLQFNLLHLLKCHDTSFQEGVSVIIGWRLNLPPLLIKLKSLFSDPEPSTRKSAVRVLKYLDYEQSKPFWPKLLDLLNDEVVEVRDAALQAILLLKPSQPRFAPIGVDTMGWLLNAAQSFGEYFNFVIEADHYVQEGSMWLTKKQFKKTTKYYEKALQCYKKYPFIRHNLACYYMRVGKIQEADRVFKQGCKFDNTTAIRVEYAHFLIQQSPGYFHEALKLLDDVLKNRAVSQLSYGEDDREIIVHGLKNILETEGALLLSTCGLAHYLQAFCYYELKLEDDWSNARNSFDLWIEGVECPPSERPLFRRLFNDLLPPDSPRKIALGTVKKEVELTSLGQISASFFQAKSTLRPSILNTTTPTIPKKENAKKEYY